jgi:putative FmdB family regulatory protein
MPIYEYRCEACQHELEALQKLSDEPLRDCPKCGAASLRKQRRLSLERRWLV